MWKNFYLGDVKRQELLRTALEWIVKSSDDQAVEKYMSDHRNDETADDLEKYFEQVIAWARGIFPKIYDDMAALEWGRLYETYHKNFYDAEKISAQVDKLYADDSVNKKSGIFEYLLSGGEITKLLHVRFHVTAWSAGGETSAANCQMLCKNHNRLKGND